MIVSNVRDQQRLRKVLWRVDVEEAEFVRIESMDGAWSDNPRTDVGYEGAQIPALITKLFLNHP